MNNGCKDNIKNDIPTIEIDDAFDSITGSRVLRNILIRTKRGTKKYQLLRTRNEKYMMQI